MGAILQKPFCLLQKIMHTEFTTRKNGCLVTVKINQAKKVDETVGELYLA